MPQDATKLCAWMVARRNKRVIVTKNMCLARKWDSASDTEIVWAKIARGVWGLANVFASGKLYFTRDVPEANCLPQRLDPPAKPPAKPAPKAAKPRAKCSQTCCLGFVCFAAHLGCLKVYGMLHNRQVIHFMVQYPGHVCHKVVCNALVQTTLRVLFLQLLVPLPLFVEGGAGSAGGWFFLR